MDLHGQRLYALSHNKKEMIMPCILSRTALVTGFASLASFAMHAQDSQQQETYNPVTYEEIENPDPTEIGRASCRERV